MAADPHTESNGAPFTEKSPPDRWPMVAAYIRMNNN